jgi:PIN domain nuclease of toxin-antitoxin system
MATYQTFTAIGQREDLADIISDISPYETPFQANIGKQKVSAKRHEWQTDALAAASTSNAKVEGADATIAASNPTVRLSNITQIMDKTVSVSGTLEAVDKAGRKSELAYQIMKRGRELKRDMEATLLHNQASSLGTSTTASLLGGLPSWLESNTNRASDGSDGGYSTSTALTVAATDTTGSGRTFTETLLKGVMQSCFINGGDPKILMLGPYNKGQFSNATNFPGIAELRSNIAQSVSKQATVIGAADVYLGDFGTLQVVPNRFQREADAYLLDPEYAAVGTLRPISKHPLAKIGDSERHQMVCEVTLVIKNEAAHGVISDLRTS